MRNAITLDPVCATDLVAKQQARKITVSSATGRGRSSPPAALATTSGVWRVVKTEATKPDLPYYHLRWASTAEGAYVTERQSVLVGLPSGCLTNVSTDEMIRWGLLLPRATPLEESYYLPEASTVYLAPPDALRIEMEALFESAKAQYFEDGMHTPFSRQLLEIVQQHGRAATEVIADLIVRGQADEEVASEALRWLGLMGRDGTHEYRLWLLENCLLCRSVKVRHGAVLGLAFLDDPRAVVHLQHAAQRESRKWLRERMERVINQLQEGA